MCFEYKDRRDSRRNMKARSRFRLYESTSQAIFLTREYVLSGKSSFWFAVDGNGCRVARGRFLKSEIEEEVGDFGVRHVKWEIRI